MHFSPHGWHRDRAVTVVTIVLTIRGQALIKLTVKCISVDLSVFNCDASTKAVATHLSEGRCTTGPCNSQSMELQLLQIDAFADE